MTTDTLIATPAALKSAPADQPSGTPSSASPDTPEAAYAQMTPALHTFDDATLALRQFGATGRPLLFIHGFPVHGYTWRKLIPALAGHARCLVLDLPGLGDSDWHGTTDFSFTAQARRICALISKLGLTHLALIAHDTGATIARLVALQCPEAVDDLVMINTEIPGHRPPAIKLHQLSSRLPLAGTVFRHLLQSRRFLHSSLAFKSFYANRDLLDQPGNLTPYVQPLIESPRRMQGMFHYLRGIDWAVVDGLAEQHPQIKARTHLIWGEQDLTFPIASAEAMRHQFNPTSPLTRIQGAALMPHEEQPQQVLRACSEITLQKAIRQRQTVMG